MITSAIMNSLFLAVVAATFAVLLGAVIGWIDLRTKLPGRKLLDYASLIPLGLPGIVMAVALIQFWLAMPLALYGTLMILLLATLCPVIRKMWRTARRGVKPALDAAEIASTESRAFLEAVERHDHLLEAQRLAAEKEQAEG